MDDNYLETSPEILKPDTVEAEARYNKWNAAMSEGVPEFTGEGAESSDNNAGKDTSLDTEFDEGLAGATRILNDGLNEVAEKYGVEFVVQGIKSFDPSGSDNPASDLLHHLGVDTPEEIHDLHDSNDINKASEAEFRERTGLQTSPERSNEGTLKAIEDMKELISEVEGADPRYAALREGARNAGKGYFEFAVDALEKRGLVELFGVLREQRETVEAGEDDISETTEVEKDEVGEEPRDTGDKASEVSEVGEGVVDIEAGVVPQEKKGLVTPEALDGKILES